MNYVNHFGVSVSVAEIKQHKLPDYWRVYYGFPKSIGERDSERFSNIEDAVKFANIIQKKVGWLYKQEIFIDFFHNPLKGGCSVKTPNSKNHRRHK